MRRSAAGFTLLEAIVALVVLSAGAMAVFAALNGALRSIERAEAATRLDTAAENAIAFLETINPMEVPEGRERIGEVEVRWRSEILAGPTAGLTDYYQPSLYEVALFRLHVELRDGDRVSSRFELRRAGWRQVRRLEVQ